MANTRGMTSTTDQASQDVVVDMQDKVLLLEPEKNTMIKTIRNLKKGTRKNPKFNWQEDQIVQFADAVASAVASAGTTTVNVDDGSKFAELDLVRVMSGSSAGEIFQVTAVATNALTVVRGISGTASTMADNDVLVKIGSSWGEGSGIDNAAGTAVNSLETLKTDQYNYMQIEKTICSETNTSVAQGQAGGYYSGDPRKYQQALRGMEHAKKMNHATIYGGRSISGNNRKTGGFLEHITRTASTTSLTPANIDTDLATFCRYGRQKKLLVTTRRVASKITANAHDKIRVDAGHGGGGDIDSGGTYGARVRTYVGDSGEFDIIIEDALSDYTAMAGYGLMLDLTDCGYVTLPGRDTKLLLDQQNPGTDGKVDLYLTEWGLERGHASHHGAWTSVAA